MSRDMTGEADGEMLSFRTSSRSEKWGDAGDRERCQDKFKLVDYLSTWWLNFGVRYPQLVALAVVTPTLCIVLLLLLLLFVCSAFSRIAVDLTITLPPMTPVFSIMSYFLYMIIFHVVAFHPVYHRITLSLTSSCNFHSAF